MFKKLNRIELIPRKQLVDQDLLSGRTPFRFRSGAFLVATRLRLRPPDVFPRPLILDYASQAHGMR